MKILCTLLSLFVVLLSARPCCADDLCLTQSSSSKQAAAAKKSTPEKECQGCSPFFSCGTCAGFIVGKQVMHNRIFIKENTVTAYAAYQQPYAQEITLSIWQPPKIS